MWCRTWSANLALWGTVDEVIRFVHSQTERHFSSHSSVTKLLVDQAGNFRCVTTSSSHTGIVSLVAIIGTFTVTGEGVWVRMAGGREGGREEREKWGKWR